MAKPNLSVSATGARRALLAILVLGGTYVASAGPAAFFPNVVKETLVAPGTSAGSRSPSAVIPVPAPGFLLHGVYPAGTTGQEHDITPESVLEYERLAGKSVAWVYFSSNWFDSRRFPTATASWIRARGSIPYIRLMLRTDAGQWHPEPVYTLERILRGDFDPDLRAWMDAARDFGSPILVEYGTEVNGEWFPWNGAWNGAYQTTGFGDRTEPDGPERFRQAYRHIVDIARREHADNVVWVFHISAGDLPSDDWNRFERYYPGDEWVDWMALSVYGAQAPTDGECPSFRKLMDNAYRRLVALAPSKPIILAEFGVTQGNPLADQAVWAERALEDLVNGRWPRVIGFAWWNEAFPKDADSAHRTTMRLQDNPALAAVFQHWVGNQPSVLGAW